MSEERKKDPLAVDLGRRGGLKGGLARAASLSPEQRSASARIAALARHGGAEEVLPIAKCGGSLKLGGLEIGCYVVEIDGGPVRVLSQGGMLDSLGMSRGGNPKLGRDRLGNFAAGKKISPFISKELAGAIQSPILFRSKPGGSAAYGYRASALADLCEAILAARAKGELQTQQLKFAEACEVLLRGFARVGIDALVDEATGYQEVRAKDALAKILEKFVAKELQPHVKTFHPDYYREMFRLRGWALRDAADTKKPPLVGKLTNNIVYARLAPGVLEELRRQTPRDDKGRLKHKLHQRLTPDLGHPKLREHLASVITIMKLSSSYADFEEKLNRLHRKYSNNYELDF